VETPQDTIPHGFIYRSCKAGWLRGLRLARLPTQSEPAERDQQKRCGRAEQ
jgi:hypothetical protein